jgi:hypothetical protein
MNHGVFRRTFFLLLVWSSATWTERAVGATEAADASGSPPGPPADPAPPAPPISSGDRRPVPDYGRPAPPPPTAREAFLWVPRTLLLPARLTTEYVVLRPTMAFVRWGDEHYVFRRIYDALTWDDGRSGVYPLASFDLGLKSTVGLAVVDGSFGSNDNSLHAAVSASTQDVLTVGAQDRLRVLRNGSGELQLGGGFTRRPDGVFYGTGADTRSSDKMFYAYETRAASVGMTGNLGGLHRTAVEIGYKDTQIRGSSITSGTPSVDARYGGAGQPPLPAGWGGYDLAWSRAFLVLDSRSPRFEDSGSGVRIDGGASFGVSPREPDLRLLGWQLEAGGYYDLSGARHVLSLQVAAHFIERVGPRPIPFTELPSLGGQDWMRGFLAGRLRGNSTLVTTLQYRYPVLALVEAEIFTALGNAFGDHLEDVALERFFLNWGVGLRTTFARDAAIAATIAFASNRLDDPAFRIVDATRISLGVIHGF